MKAHLALVLTCFFLSGFAALLYETAWTRELGFIFGTSQLAIAAVLAAYMGGLAVGAAIAARVAPRLRRPVLAYGVLELGIAICALAVPAGLALVSVVYVGLLADQGTLPEGSSTAGALLQLLGAFAVLVPPTALMGATLPLLARDAVRRDSEISSRIGLLYAINTAGAIAGTLCAAFLLIPALGLRGTVYVGVAVNALVFLVAVISRSTPLPVVRSFLPSEDDAKPRAIPTQAVWILPAIAVSGAVSFIYEVLWSRLLGHVLGSSVYAFSTMLASFLLGIALGSAVAGRLATSPARAARGFALAQAGIAITAYAGFALADHLPGLASGLGVGHGTPLQGAAIAVAVLFPMTFCVGATFPLAVRLFTRGADEAAASSAKVYALNTVGAIAGAIGAAFVLLPKLGFAGTLICGASANLLLAALTVFVTRREMPKSRVISGALIGAIVVVATLLVALPPSSPSLLLRSSPYRDGMPIAGPISYLGVGRSTTVMLIDQGSRWKLLSGGLPESMIDRPETPPMVYAANWLSLLPGLLRPDANNALVIGFGAGLVIESMPPTIETVDVVEIEEEIISANRMVAKERKRDPLADPRVRLHIGDARGALLLTQQDYDVAISQPSHPWTSGASHLYTREFFELIDSRLHPDGVFIQWVSTDMVDGPLLKSIIATLLSVFPNVEVYLASPTSLLFAASHAPIDALANARRALRLSPGIYSRHGVDQLEDVAVLRLCDEACARELSEGATPSTDDRNLLAMQATRLGAAALDPGTLHAVMDSFDPIELEAEGLRSQRLIRRLLNGDFARRAEAIAERGDGVERDLALGWIKLKATRPRSAAAHFRRALEIEPERSEALAGWAASQRAAIARGESVENVDGKDLTPVVAAVVAAWRAKDDWQAIAEHDSELALAKPGDPLFLEATRLRAQWRIDSGSVAAGAEALALSDALLVRSPGSDGLQLRAHAAQVANEPVVAWITLDYLIAYVTPKTIEIAQEMLELANSLPEHPVSKRVRRRFEAVIR